MSIRRPLAVVLLTVAVFATTVVRAWISPSAEGYRVAIAPASQQEAFRVYGRSLELISPSATTRLSDLPSGCHAADSMASDPQDPARLLLGCEGGVFLSENGGRSLRLVLRGQHFLAVALNGSRALAGEWGRGLWSSSDGGHSFLPVTVPPQDTEFNAILITPGASYAGTLLGVLVSTDGHSFQRMPGAGTRISSLASCGLTVCAASWRGDLYQLDPDSGGWSHESNLGAGIWAIDSSNWIATTHGLYLGAHHASTPLGNQEVVALARSGDTLYTVAAGGRTSALSALTGKAAG